MRKLLFFITLLLILVPLQTGLFAQKTNPTTLDSVKVLLMEGKYKESISVLNKELIVDSSNVNALYYLSLCYQSLSDYQNAAKILEKALLIKPGDIKIMTLLGNNLFASGRLISAEGILSSAFTLDSTNTQVLLSLGKVLTQNHKWNKAVKIYNMLIDKDSSNSFYFEQAAKCNTLLGNIENAIIDYQIAHRLNPLNQLTVMELSHLYYLSDKLISAMRIVDDGLSVYPGSSEMWTRKGDIFLKMQKYSGAIKSYKNSIKLGDSSLTNYRNLGISYYWSEKYDSAITALDTAISINDKDPTSYFFLGASYKSLTNYKKAIFNLLIAAALLKNNLLAETYTQIAAAYYNEKNYGEALNYYKDALKENPEKDEILFYLATVYEHFYKDKTVAIRYYKKFLADSAKVDNKLVAYAKDRLESLIEDNFMNNK